MICSAIAAVLGSLITASAFAADLPIRQPPPPPYKAPPPVVLYNWTGFYIGGNVGYGWGEADPGLVSYYDPNLVGSAPGPKVKPSGVIGGGQIGFNVQSGSLVFGLEADFMGSGMKDSFTDTVNLFTTTTSIRWLTTGRARVGLAADRALFYVTGGVAAGNVKSTLADTYNGGAVVLTNTSSATYVGWTAGGGIEYAVLPYWTVRGEVSLRRPRQERVQFL